MVATQSDGSGGTYNATAYYYGGKKFATQAARNAYIRRLNAQKSRAKAAAANRKRALAARAAAKKRAALVAAKKRRRAYEGLAKRQKAALSAQVAAAGSPVDRGLERGEQRALKDKNYRDLIAKQAAARREFAKKSGVVDAARQRAGAGKLADEGRSGQERARARKLEELKAGTKTYEDVFKEIADAQAQTGGRYLDRELYLKAQQQYQQKIAAIDKYVRALAAEGKQAFEAKDYDALREVQKKWDEAIKQWKAVFGDGTKTGEAERVAKLQQQVARSNDLYFQRSIFGNAASTDDRVAEMTQRNLDKALTRTRTVRGPKGKPVEQKYRITVQQYLEELAQKEQEKLIRARRDFISRGSILRKEGFVPDGKGGYQSRVWKDNVEPVLRRALGGRYDPLLKDLSDGNMVDRSRALDEITRTALARRERELRDMLGIGYRQTAFEGQSPKEAQLGRYLEQFRQELYQSLTGGAAPGGLEQLLGAAIHTPLLGEALKGIGALGAGLTGAIRWIQTDTGDRVLVDENGRVVDAPNASGGRAVTADLNLSSLFSGDFGNVITRTPNGSQQEILNEVQAKVDFGRVINEADGDWGKVLDAMLTYGAEPFQGNIGSFIAQAALDPTIALSITKFLRAGRLAAVRAGGLRGLTTTKAGLIDWTRLTLPKSLGGAAKSELTLRQTLHDLRSVVGHQIKDVGDIDAAVMDKALRSLIEHPRTVEQAQSFLAKQFKVTPANAAQILQSVQAYAEKKAGALGVKVVNTNVVEDYLKVAEKHAPAVAGQASRELRRIGVEKAAESVTHAVQKVRAVAAGQPVPVRPKTLHTPRLSRARREYVRMLEQRRSLAGEAQKAAAVLRESADPDARRAAYEALERSVDEIRRMDTAPKDFATPLDRAHQSYEQAVTNSRSPRQASIGDLTAKEIAADIYAAEVGLRRTQAALKASPSSVALKRQLREFTMAHEALKEYKARARAQGDVAKEVVGQGRAVAREYVRPTTLFVRARSKKAIEEEAGRDLYTQYTGSDILEPRIAPGEAAAVRDTIARADEVKARPHPILADMLGPEVLDDFSLWELTEALQTMVSAGNGQYGEALALLVKQLEALLPRRMRWPAFWEAVGALPDAGPDVGLALFEKLDTAVKASFRRWGIHEAKGQTRFGRVITQPPGIGRHDRGLLQTLAKVEALRGTGVSLQMYDEVRQVLSGTALKRRASETMLRHVELRMKKYGETWEEAFAVAAEAKQAREAGLALERFAMEPRFEGWKANEILAVFEEEQITRDLVEQVTERSHFQGRSLRLAVAEQGGIWRPGQRLEEAVDDPVYMARVFGGRVVAPEGSRLATPAEMNGIEMPVPTFVTNKDPLGVFDKPGVLGVYYPGYGIFLREGIPKPSTPFHEYAHAALIDLEQNAPAFFHSLAEHVTGMFDDGVFKQSDFAAKITSGNMGGRFDPHELLAELYANWKMGADYPAEFVTPAGKRLSMTSWADLRARLAPADGWKMDYIAARFGSLPVPDREAFGIRGYNVPPLHSRQAAYQWLVDNGFWAKRTADRVRQGGRVWSLEAERRFFQTRFGFSPPWTDPDIIRGALDDPRAYKELMESFGFLDNGFELHAAALNLDADGLANAMAFGSHEAKGIKRARTRDELRDWFGKRYGDLVLDENGNFKTVPWLMDAGSPEYKRWTERMIREGHIINPTLIKPHQLEAFVKAYHGAIDRRLARMTRDGRLPLDENWLPQEQMRFAIDVTNELLTTRAWRSLLEKDPIGHRGLRLIGEIQRLTVVFQLAFPIMNLIDRFTVKQVLLMVANDGYRFWHAVDQDALETVADLRSINIRQRGLWDMRTSGGWERLRNSDLDRRTRVTGLFEGVRDLGYEISSWGEDSLRLNFARRVYMSIRDDLIEQGVDPENARVLALGQARRKVSAFFPTLEDAGDLEKALNQLVPFLSYNARNTVIGMKFVVGHPYLWNLQNYIGNLIESANRDDWERKHPEGPLPDKYARRLLLRFGEETYALDLAPFSDWFRGPEKFASESRDPDTLLEQVRAWFRVPHPAQAAFLAFLEGGTTPWGTQATVSSFLPLADFLPGLFGPGESSGLDPFQFLMKQLFYQEVAKVSPTESRVVAYFDLVNAGLRADANRLLDMYPDVEMWLQAHTDSERFRFRESFELSWFRGRSREETRAYEAARAGLDRLRGVYDERLARMYGEPWSEKYRDLKKERRAAILDYMLTHPELIDARTMSMDFNDWLREEQSWAVDDLVDEFLRQDAKRKAEVEKIPDELERLKARRRYLEWREAWLSGNSAVADALSRTNSQIELAWRAQEESWRQIARHELDVRIARIEEERKGSAADKDLIDLLYDWGGAQYDLLDGEAFVSLYELRDKAGAPRGGLVEALTAMFRLPGRADLFYDRATEEQKLKLDKDVAYRDGVKKVLDKYGKDFYGGLEKAGLLEEYLRRNPDKRSTWVRYRDGRRYYNEISALHRAATSGKDFYDRLRANPWLMKQYFARNPDAKARYESGQAYFKAMSRWAKLLDAGNMKVAMDYFDSLPSWIREKYYAKHPERRRGAVQSGAYGRAMQEWVDLLKAEKYDEAKRYFNSLPTEIRERYFAKHPDKRAQYGGDDAMLAAAKDYFLASPELKAEVLARNPAFAQWFRAQGGNEAQRRGMILAAYRSIPKDEAWMKRVFRERYPEIFSQEALGEQRLKSVARKLAEHPALLEPYERWVEYEYRVYQAQFRRSGKPPKPLEKEYLDRWKKRQRRRRNRHAEYSNSLHGARGLAPYGPP